MPSRGRLPDVRKAHEDLLEQGAAPVGVREVVADSWLRSVAAGVDVDASRPPITLDRDLLSEYRAAHPLATVFPLLYDVLGRAAEDCGSVMAVSDAHGQLLWVRGQPGVLRRAESIQFVVGARWDDQHAGTNAPGTALRLDAPVTITSAVSVGGRRLRLSPRHSELMVILATCPGGLTGDELAYLLYPADVMPSTPRAELVRMRALLGEHVLASRPYRLTCEVRSDWTAVTAQLAAGNLAGALRLYRGPLLPHSEAPGVTELRTDLERALRAAILASGEPEHMLSWTRTRWGADDLPMWQRLRAVLPAGSPLRPIAAATAARLDAELGC